MNPHPKLQIFLKLAIVAFAPFIPLWGGGCAHSKPTAPPVVSLVSPGQTDGDSNFGAEVMVNSTTETATVVSIDTNTREIVLKRTDGRLAHCRVRPGVVAEHLVKVGDEVTIAVGSERSLALGKTAPPSDPSAKPGPVHVRVPANLVGVAEATETLEFTGRIVSIDIVDRLVLLELAKGRKIVRPGEAVNLADFKPGDEVSARITEVVVLTVQRPPPK